MGNRGELGDPFWKPDEFFKCKNCGGRRELGLEFETSAIFGLDLQRN